jgi:hypothetical protein
MFGGGKSYSPTTSPFSPELDLCDFFLFLKLKVCQSGKNAIHEIHEMPLGLQCISMLWTFLLRSMKKNVSRT